MLLKAHMNLRLPPVVQCLAYDLTFTVDPGREDFQCEAVVDLEGLETCDNVQLNALNLIINAAKVNDTSVHYSLDKENQTLKIHHALKAGGKAKLSFLCAGQCSKDMYGIYRSSYEDYGDDENESQSSPDDDGAASTDANLDLTSGLQQLDLSKEKTSTSPEEKFLISTQFEPIGARRAFPCIDDPARKSYFTVTLVHPSNHTALLNCPILELTKIDEYWLRTKFERSPLMSTYLVAFVVGELESLKSETLLITAWTVPGGAEEAGFALDVAEKCFPLFEDLFDFKYPLAKLDFVAIPDFAKSAMENFGLITFKESDFLVGSNPSKFLKSTVFETVSHEISHQWFGNLVTMDFWDDLWLNEGFATWLLWYVMDHFHPEWNVWEDYIVYTLLTAFTIDSRASSHSINMPIETLADIEQAGDGITYQKGCALVVMLFDFLGKDAFFGGLKQYIRSYAWANAKASDLWQSFASYTGLDIGGIMNCWVTRPGFPIVEVEELESNNLRLTQKRFLPTGDSRNEEPYLIPLTIATTKETVKAVFKTSTIEISIPEGPYFINPSHHGYYVASYSTGRWDKLLKSKVSRADQIGALLDCELASFDGETLVVSFLQLAEEFAKLHDSFLMNAIVESFYDLSDAYLFDEAVSSGVCRFGESIIKEHIPTVTSDDDPDDDAQFKNVIFRLAAYIKAPEIDQYCDQQFEDFINDQNELKPDEAAIILRNIVRRNGMDTWDSLWDRYQKETDIYTKEDILFSLGNSSDPEILDKFLKLILESCQIDAQDIVSSLAPIKNTAIGVDYLWAWLRDNWEALATKLEYGSVVHLGIFGASTSGLCTREHYQQLAEFFEGKEDTIFKGPLANALEKIKGRYLRAERNRESVIGWLVANNLLVSENVNA